MVDELSTKKFHELENYYINTPKEGKNVKHTRLSFLNNNE